MKPMWSLSNGPWKNQLVWLCNFHYQDQVAVVAIQRFGISFPAISMIENPLFVDFLSLI